MHEEVLQCAGRFVDREFLGGYGSATLPEARGEGRICEEFFQRRGNGGRIFR